MLFDYFQKYFIQNLVKKISDIITEKNYKCFCTFLQKNANWMLLALVFHQKCCLLRKKLLFLTIQFVQSCDLGSFNRQIGPRFSLGPTGFGSRIPGCEMVYKRIFKISFNVVKSPFRKTSLLGISGSSRLRSPD